MQLTREVRDLFRQSALFRRLDDDCISAAIAAASIRQVGDGGFFFMEEDDAQNAYLLWEGRVKLTQSNPDGQQVLLGYLVPGRVFGIIAALKKMTYPVTAEAVGSCRAYCWDQQAITELMERYPRLALNALRIMAGQIRMFQNRVRELSTQRVEQRIARAILRLAQQSGRAVTEGVLIDLPLTRQDIAEMTGTTLYSVSRVLKSWEKRGLVRCSRQQIVIRQPHQLVLIGEDLPPWRDKNSGDLCDLG